MLTKQNIYKVRTGLILLIFIVFALISLNQIRRADEAAKWVAHTQEVLFHSEKMLSIVAEVETDSCAYLLSGIPYFLSAFGTSEKELPGAFATLKKLTADNEVQQPRIDSVIQLVSKRLVFCDSAVNLKKNNIKTSLLALVTNSRSDIYLDNTRELVNEIQQMENTLLLTRKKVSKQQEVISYFVFLSLVFMMLILLLILFKKENKLRADELSKKAGEKLRKVESDFQLLVSSVKDYAIFLLDKDGNVASWNTGAEHIKGYTEEEIIGKSIDVFYTAEEVENGEPKSNLQMALQNGQFETEGWRVRKDGSTFYANVVFTSLVDNEGKFYGYAKVTKDITEKRKAEERIRFLASIAENIQDPVISTNNYIDNDFKITGWNKPAEKLLEWKSEEVIGKNASQIFKTDFPIETREQIFELLKTKGFWQGEFIYHKKSGSPVYVLSTISYIKDAEGNVAGNLFLIRDITERIKAEEKLKEFEHFFNNSNDLSCIANKEGYFEILNPGFKKVLGYSQNELSENPFLDFVHPDDIPATLHQYGKLKSGALVIHFLNRYRKKDGTYLWFEWNATPNPLTGKLYCIARDITDRKKAEDALSKLNEELEQKVADRTETINRSEKQYRYLFENNPLPMFIMDVVTFKILDVNEMAIFQYGYSREEFLSMTAFDIRPEKDIELFKQLDFSFNPESVNYNKGVWNHRKKDGTIIQAEVIAHDILFEGIEARLILSKDVTEQKKAEEKLASSEMRFRSLIENSAEGIAMTDEYSNILYRSPGAVKITGILPKENTISLTHPEDLEIIKNKLEEVLKNQGVPIAFEGRFLNSLGHYFWMEGTFTNLLHMEGVNAIVTNYRDITERKKAGEMIAETLKEKNIILESIGDAFFAVDKNWTVTYWNRIAEIALRVRKYEIVGKNLWDIFSDSIDSASYKKYQQAVLTNQVVHFEDYYTALNRWYEISAYPSENGLSVYFKDITERRQAEQKIKKLNIELEERVAQRTGQLKKTNEELEAFSYSVSHDLRAPLRGIMGFANILEEDYGKKLDPEAKRIIGVVKNNTLKMGRLIDDLLTFSRTGRQEIVKSEINMNEMVNEIINESGNLNIKRRPVQFLIQELPFAYGDKNTIRQVWVNLISNAVKYSGEISLPEIEIGSLTHKHTITFYVKDNGVGFDEKYKNKLFKVFQRLHNSNEFEGTGIGLAIVEKIISRHGGEVWADAKPGEGATFYFSLPCN